jgi:ribosomal protein L3
LYFAVLFEGLEGGLVTEIGLLVVALLKIDVSQVEVAVGEKVVQLNGALVGLDGLVVVLQTAVRDTQEEEQLRQLHLHLLG